ncbi:MAG: efflux transporter outer membrane subunit [Legionella sp.]|jgi:NodT family efflux transporter outer membrane factor (OMF) lipoprotein
MGFLIRRLLVLTLSVLVSACLVGPNYKRPLTVVPPKFKEAKGKAFSQWKPIKPQDAVERGLWWQVFNDPLLNHLENELNAYNQNIANAAANYQQAMALVEEARSNYFPLLTATYNIFRQKAGGGSTTFFSTNGNSTTTGTANTSVAGGKLPTTTTYSSSLNATWEPDIWGLVRRTVEASMSTAQSDAALLAVTRLSAQAALAQYYFELRMLDKDQVLLDNTVNDYKKSLQLTRNQYRSGVASRADIVQAQTQLENAQAQALNNGILRGQYEHAIAVLIGRPPAALTLRKMPLTAKPPVIPVSVPSLLLERRPDIAQAERLVQTSSAQIGIAIAAYYPSLTLSGTGSAAGRSMHQLLHSPSLGWSLGLQAAETIFDGGLRKAVFRAARANYDAQVAAYRQVVLTAFQDVEDNLSALRILKQQRIVQEQAAASARLALKLVINQYKSGTVDYSSVITAQIAAYSAQKAANDVAGLEMTAAVALIKALGGGWEPVLVLSKKKKFGIIGHYVLTE